MLSSFLSSLPAGARVGVVGSRSFPSAAPVLQFVSSLPAGCVVVSGGASGADSFAAAAAAACGLELEVFSAAWSRFGRAAGPVRNRALVRSGLACLVVFVLDPSSLSPGSASAVKEARKAGVPVFVFGPEGPFNNN